MIQKLYRWRWSLLPWAVAAVRLQRAWRDVLHQAKRRNVQAMLHEWIERGLKTRMNSIESMCRARVHLIVDILLSSRQLRLLDLIRDQRVQERKHSNASRLQRWMKNSTTALRLERWLFLQESNKKKGAIGLQRLARGRIVRDQRRRHLDTAAGTIQDAWKSRNVYPEQALISVEERQHAIVNIQAAWRSALVRHDNFRNYVWYWIAPMLQGIVRGYLLRNVHPLGRYFRTHLPMYMQSWRRCVSIEKETLALSTQRKNHVVQLSKEKKNNIRFMKGMNRMENRLIELEENPIQHLNKVEHQLQFATKVEQRKQERVRSQSRRDAPATTIRSLSNSPMKKKKRYNLSPVKLQKGRPSSLLGESGSSGTAYTVSGQNSALEKILHDQKDAEETIQQLRRQLNILQAKLESDLRITQAECQAKINVAHRIVVDRQLRHELAVSELKSVYRVHEEAIKTISPHRRVDDVGSKFLSTLKMKSTHHANNASFSSPAKESEEMSWSGVGLIENIDNSKGLFSMTM